VRQTEYKWVYLYAAVNPVTGASSAMIAPTVNTECMNVHLRWISEAAGPGTQVVLVLDRAGWHVAKELRVPDNITLLHLPSYSPELNPVERLWGYMFDHFLSNRIYTDEDELAAVCADAWTKLDEARLRSVCRTDWVERRN